MQNLLGIPDAKVGDKVETSWRSNKIGGTPDWYDNDDKIAAPLCGNCSTALSLVVQLYCPLDLSHYHRTLYVFGCPQMSCWNTSQSWVVYRCQQLEKVEHVPTVPVPSTDDWGDGADTWGDEADDWGDKGVDNCGDDGADNWGGKGADDWEDDDDEDMGSVKDDLTDSQSTDDVPTNTFEVMTAKTIDDLHLGEMCIDDLENNASGEGESLKHVVAEQVGELSSESRTEKLKSLTAMSPSSCSVGGSVIESFYLNVIEEPSETWDDTRHVTKLLREYQQKEAGDIGNSTEQSSGAGSRGSEKYEKMSLPHKDVMFHKFSKRLALYPQQCVRYCWSGEPLYITALKQEKQPTRCHHCAGELVFELQLTPTLVNFLHIAGASGPVIEFGTLLVFTCKESCWGDTATWREETLIVQADPDQHLFV